MTSDHQDRGTVANGPSASGAAAVPGRGLTKEEAFQRILEGHWRYLQNQRENVTTTHEDRSRHSQGQYPFAALLGCADSRVSPEVIFDQGQGDIFVVRVAGHVVGDFEVASLEYAIQHLGVSLVIVMGHEHCGAVKSALGVKPGTTLEGPIGKLLQAIEPAVVETRGCEGDVLGMAIRSHVRHSVDALLTHSVCMRDAVSAGTLRVIGMVYELASGDIDIQKTVG